MLQRLQGIRGEGWKPGTCLCTAPLDTTSARLPAAGWGLSIRAALAAPRMSLHDSPLVLLQGAVERLTEQVCKTSRLPGLESTGLEDMIQWAGEQLQQMQETVSVSVQSASQICIAGAQVLHDWVVQLHCHLSACAGTCTQCVLQEAAEAEPIHGIPGLLLADGELLEEQKTSFKLRHSTSTVGRSV